MDENIKTWLYDILNAIVEIDSFFENRPKVFTDYQKDLRTKRAVERNIEIIGEAMNRILKLDETIAITNSRRLVDVRGVITELCQLKKPLLLFKLLKCGELLQCSIFQQLSVVQVARYPIAKHNIKLGQRQAPIMQGHCPFLRYPLNYQVNKL